MDDDIPDDGSIIFYYKCLKCGKANSHLAYPPMVGPFTECPHCGGAIEFEPNCYTCEELKNGVMCDVTNCIGFRFYKQRKAIP